MVTDPSTADPSHDKPTFWTRFKAVVFAAAIISCLLYILDHKLHLLGPIDGAVMRLSYAIKVKSNNRADHGEVVRKIEEELGKVDAVPVMALIDDQSFEQVLLRQRPFRSGSVGKIITHLVQQPSGPPAVIALDLDISPSLGELSTAYAPEPGDPPGHRTSKSTENAILAALSNCVSVAILDPLESRGLMVDTGPVEQWLDDLTRAAEERILKAVGDKGCSPGFAVTSPALDYNYGLVMHFTPTVVRPSGQQVPRLGVAAAALFCRARPEHGPCRAGPDWLSSVPLRPTFQRIEAVPDRRIINSSLLTAALARSSGVASHGSVPQLKVGNAMAYNMWSAVGQDQTDRVVFIGVDSKGIDRHETWMNSAAGVDIHAAIFHSVFVPRKPISNIMSLVLDLLVGTAVGVLLASVLHHRSQLDVRLHHWRKLLDASSRVPPPRAKLRPFLLYLGSTGLTLVITVGIVFLLYCGFQLSAWLMAREIWFNPLPVILGVILHLLLEDREALVAVDRPEQMEKDAGVHGFAAALGGWAGWAIRSLLLWGSVLLCIGVLAAALWADFNH